MVNKIIYLFYRCIIHNLFLTVHSWSCCIQDAETSSVSKKDSWGRLYCSDPKYSQKNCHHFMFIHSALTLSILFSSFFLLNLRIHTHAQSIIQRFSYLYSYNTHYYFVYFSNHKAPTKSDRNYRMVYNNPSRCFCDRSIKQMSYPFAVYEDHN